MAAQCCSASSTAASRSADRQILCPSLSPDRVAALGPELVELLANGGAERGDGVGGAAVGAAHRLLDDPVDDAQLLQILRRHPHRLRGVGGFFGGAPKDR